MSQPHSKSIIAASRQKPNPMMKFVRGIQIIWSDTLTFDFSIDGRMGILFLDLLYQTEKPNYLSDRIDRIKEKLATRVLLVLVNIENNVDELITELEIFCISKNFTVFLSFSNEEAARCIWAFWDSLKYSAAELKATNETNLQIAIECLHGLGLTRKDAEAVARAFPTLSDCLLASREDFISKAILSETKIDFLLSVIHSDFCPSNDE